jgi:hypothetical protein
MIRSGRIPPVLNRICDAQIPTALLVTADGELLGANSNHAKYSGGLLATTSHAALGTLLADIAVDYQRMGEDLARVDASLRNNNNNNNSSHLDCLLLDLAGGVAGVAACGIDCFVLVVAKPDTPPGLIKARLRSLADHIQEALSVLAVEPH